MPNLEVVHVLTSPPDGWAGESGRIMPVFSRVTCPGSSSATSTSCVPPRAMMDAMEDVLMAVGVPFAQVSTERFDMV